jgi:hypothetical protein
MYDTKYNKSGTHIKCLRPIKVFYLPTDAKWVALKEY